MFGVFRSFYLRYHTYFEASFFFLIIGIWLLGPALFNLLSTGIAFASSFAIILLIISMMQHHLDALNSKPCVRVSKDQNANNTVLMEYIHKHHIKKARLIEYDADTIKPLILELLNQDVHVHLLVQHPDQACSEHQHEKIVHQIRTAPNAYPNLKRLKMQYYRDIASIRGRRFDDLVLSIGWYTYDRRLKKEKQQVWGHTNPALVFDLHNSESDVVAEMFDTVFKNLSANSEDYDSVREKFVERTKGVTP